MAASTLVRVVQSATGLPRRHTAIISASTTSCEVMLPCIDQPTIRREYRSSTAAT